MKKIILVCCLLALAGCISAESNREAQPLGKGMNLYSFKPAGKGWQFKMIPNINGTLPFELTGAEFERLEGALKNKFEKEISMTGIVDSSLIGGAIIRAGDTVIDGSVRGKLAKLAESVQRT